MPNLTQSQINARMLHAAEIGDLASVLFLAPNSTNLANSRQNAVRTPLLVAAANGHLDIVTALLPWVLDGEGENFSVFEALDSAIFGGQVDCARSLAAALGPSCFSRSNGAQRAAKLLGHAIDAPKNETASLLIVFDLVGEDRRNALADNALRHAAKVQKPDFLRILLPFSEPNSQDADGCTALILSCSPLGNGAPPPDGRATEFLLPVSDPGIQNSFGNTAWDVAMWHDAWPCVDALAVDRLRRNPDDAKLRAFLGREKARLPKASAFLQAEELAAVVRAVSQNTGSQREQTAPNLSAAAVASLAPRTSTAGPTAKRL